MMTLQFFIDIKLHPVLSPINASAIFNLDPFKLSLFKIDLILPTFTIKLNPVNPGCNSLTLMNLGVANFADQLTDLLGEYDDSSYKYSAILSFKTMTNECFNDDCTANLVQNSNSYFCHSNQPCLFQLVLRSESVLPSPQSSVVSAVVD